MSSSLQRLTQGHDFGFIDISLTKVGFLRSVFTIFYKRDLRGKLPQLSTNVIQNGCCPTSWPVGDAVLHTTYLLQCCGIGILDERRLLVMRDGSVLFYVCFFFYCISGKEQLENNCSHCVHSVTIINIADRGWIVRSGPSKWFRPYYSNKSLGETLFGLPFTRAPFAYFIHNL